MVHPFIFLKPLCRQWIIILLFLVGGCKKEAEKSSSPGNPNSSPYSLTSKRIKLSDHINGYYEYLPQGYSTDVAGTSYPLLLFLHGGGETGQDSSALNKLLLHGPLSYVKRGTFPTSFTVNNDTYKFIIIAPQITSSDDAYPKEIDQFIEFVANNYRVNRSRIYLTGLSYGGGVAWNYLGKNSSYARKIAAMVPVAAYLSEVRDEFHINPGKAKIIAESNVPVWSTHNSGDDVCPLSWTRNAHHLLKTFNPNVSLKLTVFNSDKHEGWTTTYDPLFTENGMNIYEWMLQHHR